MNKRVIVAVGVLGLGAAFAAGALAQQAHTPAAVMLHVVSPSGEATLAIDHGEITLAVADSEVRLAVKGDADVTPARTSGASVQMTNPMLVFSRALAGSQSPTFEMSADRVTSTKPERH